MFEKFPKIRYLLLVIFILIIILLIQRFLVSPKDKPGDYFPNEEMIKSFKGGLDNDEFTQIVDTIEDGKIQIKQINNYTKVVMVYDISKDTVKLIYTLEETDQLKDDYITGLKENRNDIIIKSPLRAATSWEDNIGGVYRIIEMDSVVKTPAGEFKTMVIGYKNDDFNVKEYYAKDIGLVKIVINNFLVNELVDLEIIN